MMDNTFGCKDNDSGEDDDDDWPIYFPGCYPKKIIKLAFPPKAFAATRHEFAHKLFDQDNWDAIQ